MQEATSTTRADMSCGLDLAAVEAFQAGFRGQVCALVRTATIRREPFGTR
jgi:hypothetical protein